MAARNIIVGQRISSAKKEVSKLLRKEMTPAERKLWQHLRRNRINGHHFRRQQIIDGFIVDFYCHSGELIVEVDGDIHELTKEADVERDAILSARGLRVLRVANDAVFRDMTGVLRAIAKNLTPRPPSLRGKGETGSAVGRKKTDR